MHEQDDDPRPPSPSPSDAWAADAPTEPGGPRCPWCSQPLPDAAATRCAACGAIVAGGPESPILGVTAVAPPVAGRAATRATGGQRRSMLAWITGDEDLVDVPPPPIALPPLADGSEVPEIARVAPLGPASADALTPPDARLRREMLRVQLEAEGFVVTEDAPGIEPGSGPGEAVPEDAAPAVEAPGGATPDPAEADPAGADPAGPDAPDAT